MSTATDPAPAPGPGACGFVYESRQHLYTSLGGVGGPAGSMCMRSVSIALTGGRSAVPGEGW